MGFAYTSRGSTFWYSTSGTSYTQIPKATEIEPPGAERGDIDDTTLDSTGDTKEYAPGWIEPGEVSLKARYDSNIYQALLSLHLAGDNLYWRIKLPITGSMTTPPAVDFRGYLKKCRLGTLNTDEQNKLSLELSVKVSGLPTFTPGS